MKASIVLGPFLSLVMIASVEAKTLELPYQAVMQVRESRAVPVLDDKKHVIGTGAFKGLAIFADGKIALHRYEGWFDLKGGSGRFHGYILWKFEDGSEIRAAYDGHVGKTPTRGFAVKARIHGVSGTGRFAKASGGGSFHGRRFEPIAQGGTTHVTGTLTLSVPE